jgi:hypothetical protein
VPYAIPIDGPIGAPGANIPIPVGRAGVADPDYQSGFRAGVSFALDGCRSVTARFSQLESSTEDRVSTTAQQVVRPLVAHPASTNASSDFLQALANYDIDFDLIDVEFRQLLHAGPNYAVNYSIGGRYAKLNQDLQTTFSDNGVAIVDTNVGFDGGGLRLGLDTERYAMARCWHVYARGAASFVAGQFRTRYFQGDSFDPVVADTAWEAGRVVTILDIEAGLGWRSPNGHLRINAGYLFSSWLNTVTTDEFIRSVQTGTLVSSDDSLSFDGLTAGAELRF